MRGTGARVPCGAPGSVRALNPTARRLGAACKGIGWEVRPGNQRHLPLTLASPFASLPNLSTASAAAAASPVTAVSSKKAPLSRGARGIPCTQDAEPTPEDRVCWGHRSWDDGGWDRHLLLARGDPGGSGGCKRGDRCSSPPLSALTPMEKAECIKECLVVSCGRWCPGSHCESISLSTVRHLFEG